MISRASKSVTLLELLISIVLIALVVLGLSSMETFCRTQLLSSDRRVKITNEASFILDHMAKHLVQAINEPTATGDPVILTPGCFRIRVDANQNGVLDTGGDHFIAYRNSGSLMEYCANLPFNNVCTAGCATGNPWEILSRYMSGTNYTYSNSNNFVEVNITLCAEPGSPATCGKRIVNPSVNMKSTILMPSVSVR